MPPMSRRTGSRASSVNPSPLPPTRNTRATNGGNTTTRRAGYNPNPNIQIRTAAANAYGDPSPEEPKNTTKGTRKRPTLQETLRSLEPEPQRPRPEAGRAPHRNAKPVDPNRSFRDESIINTNAGFDTSSILEPPDEEDSEEDSEEEMLAPPPKRPTQRQSPQKTSPATRHSPRTHLSAPKHISPVKEPPYMVPPHMVPVPESSSEETKPEPSVRGLSPAKVPPPKESPGFWEGLLPTVFGTPNKSPPKVPSAKKSPPKVSPPKVYPPEEPPHVSPPKVYTTEVSPPKASPPKASPPKLPSPKRSPPKSPRRHGESTFEAWTKWGGNLIYFAWETIIDWLKHISAVFPWFLEKFLQLFGGGFSSMRRFMKRCCLILIPLSIASLLIASLYSTAKNHTAPGFSTPSVSEWNLGQYVPETPDFTWITDIPAKIYNRIPWPQGTTDSMDYNKLFDALIEDGKLSDTAIEDLLAVLPDNVVLTKDRNGDLQITNDLWGAIGDKMSGKKNPETWNRFVKENDRYLNNLNKPDFQQRFPQIVKKNVPISKKKMIEMLDHDYKKQTDSMHPDFKSLKADVQKLQKDKLQNAEMSKEQAKMLLEDQIQAMVSSGQWKALVQANMKSNLNYGLTRINHWSRGTGATVDGTVTSPNYVFPFMKKTWPTKQFRRVLGNAIPVPNPPAAALEKWDEHGDCWCSPAADSDGYGPTLGVISSHQFYPDEVVIEHITPAASIAPGATPKNMELLAYIDDFDTYDAVLKLSENLFNDGVEVEPKHEFHYIKIASWTFDMAAGEPVQAFPVQLDLKQFEAPINRLVVRAKDNWGKEEYTCLYRVRVHGDIVGQEK